MTPKTSRLARLATLLENYHDEPDHPQFDLQTWGKFRTERHGFFGPQRVTNCCTAACAIGLACLSGEFSKDGLTHEIRSDGQLIPVWSGNRAWMAVEEFFGLYSDQSNHLFSQMEYDGPITGEEGAQAVASRLREFIREPPTS